MSIVKSLSVGEGDMFYIVHGSSNFSIIDCCMNDENQEIIVEEIAKMRKGKDITRFISTHPDEDHIEGLEYLDGKLKLVNFYCVKNEAIKENPSSDFNYYCSLRDGEFHYYVYKGCKRKWMNDNDENDGKNYGSSGINFLWPIEDNEDYKEAIKKVKDGQGYNNISPIFTYSVEKGVTMMWMGDMEKDFLDKIKDNVEWPEIDILFAPHHGRDSGKVPSDVLDKLNPSVIIIGEAASKDLNYYQGYNTITQNSAGDIVFDNNTDGVHIYVSSSTYSVDFLNDMNKSDNDYYYIGSFIPKNAEGK